MSTKRYLAAGLMASALAFSLIGCGGSDSQSSDAEPKEKTSAKSERAEEKAAGQFGEACASIPKSGPGSFDGMAQDPVATAASNNPALSTLTKAVKKAGLVDTLNSAEDLTVFAPTNDAFAKIPKKDLNAVLSDKKTLTKILTYHVVEGKNTPKQLSSAGKLDTLQGKTVTPEGADQSYTVNGASVVCGNVQTSNATVYIIDTVLMPK